MRSGAGHVPSVGRRFASDCVSEGFEPGAVLKLGVKSAGAFGVGDPFRVRNGKRESEAILTAGPAKPVLVPNHDAVFSAVERFAADPFAGFIVHRVDLDLRLRQQAGRQNSRPGPVRSKLGVHRALIAIPPPNRRQRLHARLDRVSRFSRKYRIACIWIMRAKV